jgi:hypothetical protein
MFMPIKNRLNYRNIGFWVSIYRYQYSQIKISHSWLPLKEKERGQEKLRTIGAQSLSMKEKERRHEKLRTIGAQSLSIRPCACSLDATSPTSTIVQKISTIPNIIVTVPTLIPALVVTVVVGGVIYATPPPNA